MVIASEQACGLTYDQPAIARYISEHIAADDMEFAGTLALLTRGHGRDIERMSTSGVTAHCAQIKRVAKSYGFVRE